MMNPKKEICNTFNKQAPFYEKAAKVQLEIGTRLFERLDYLTMKPLKVLDLGSGTGFFSKLLKKKYPKSHIVSLDVAHNMLIENKKKQGIFNKWSLVAADMATLPFISNSFDLVYANQSIHWGGDFPIIFKEIYRILKKEGCFLFTTLGPDTFKELKSAWLSVDQYGHTNNFLDMHDIGDSLLKEKFADPVVDMEFLTVRYNSVEELLFSLKAQGVKNIHPERNAGLTGRNALRKFKESYQTFQTPNGKFPLTYEVVYAQAWKAETHLKNNDETYIPISQIRRKMPLK